MPKGKIIIKKSEPDTFKPQKMFGLVSALSEGLEVRARYILKGPNKFFLSFAEASLVFFQTKLLLYIE